jgi:hypothetical protein
MLKIGSRAAFFDCLITDPQGPVLTKPILPTGMAQHRATCPIVWWMPCFAASCAAVSCPLGAFIARLALQTTEYRVRFALPNQSAER